MMKEILHSLPRPWPEDLPERVTRLFLQGLAGVGSSQRPKPKRPGGKGEHSEQGRETRPPKR